MADRPKILVTQQIPKAAYQYLYAVGDVEANQQEGVIWSAEELLQRAPGHDYLYCLVTNTIDAHLLEACTAATPRLKLVANMAVGYNNIDVAAATRLNIAVTNTPGVLSDTTADLTFGLLMATARRISEGERFLRAGKFTGWDPLLLCGTDVHHATLGIIGMGRIGKLVARRASGFDMKVLYHNRQRLSAEEEQRYDATYVSLEELLHQSDFVCLQAPYSPETHHLIGEKELQMMKPGSFLINTARGPMVDEKALVQALQRGTIAGAGLDVFEHEPAVEPELLDMENVVLLPHIGSASQQTRTRMATMASENIAAHASGLRPPNILNPEVLTA
jgi:glyoxylate reductase